MTDRGEESSCANQLVTSTKAAYGPSEVMPSPYSPSEGIPGQGACCTLLNRHAWIHAMHGYDRCDTPCMDTTAMLRRHSHLDFRIGIAGILGRFSDYPTHDVGPV